MPIYEYRCPECMTVAERIRKYGERDDPVTCLGCAKERPRIYSAPHLEPDGIYSHDPNLGDPVKFDRQYEESKAKAK